MKLGGATSWSLRLQWVQVAGLLAWTFCNPEGIAEISNSSQPVGHGVYALRAVLGLWFFSLVGALRAEDPWTLRKAVQYGMLPWLSLGSLMLFFYWKHRNDSEVVVEPIDPEKSIPLLASRATRVAVIAGISFFNVLHSIVSAYAIRTSGRKTPSHRIAKNNLWVLRFLYATHGCGYAVFCLNCLIGSPISSELVAEIVGRNCIVKILIGTGHLGAGSILLGSTFRGIGVRSTIRYYMFGVLGAVMAVVHALEFSQWAEYKLIFLSCVFVHLFEVAYPSGPRSVVALRLLSILVFTQAYILWAVPQTTSIVFFVSASITDSIYLPARISVAIGASVLFTLAGQWKETHRKILLRAILVVFPLRWYALTNGNFAWHPAHWHTALAMGILAWCAIPADELWQIGGCPGEWLLKCCNLSSTKPNKDQAIKGQGTPSPKKARNRETSRKRGQ